jgi:alginate O-acetyltransferase complex protein AlgI
MTFTSWQFGVFAATVFAAYYLPALRSFQVQLLVVASLFFYGYGQPELLALLAVAVFGTYLFLVLALRNRKAWLPVGIAFNLARSRSSNTNCCSSIRRPPAWWTSRRLISC